MPNVLTWDEIEVLSLGLGFCPDQTPDVFEVIKDLNLFVRKLSLKAIHQKAQLQLLSLNALMKSKISECHELRELLTTEESLSLTPPIFIHRG